MSNFLTTKSQSKFENSFSESFKKIDYNKRSKTVYLEDDKFSQEVLDEISNSIRININDYNLTKEKVDLINQSTNINDLSLVRNRRDTAFCDTPKLRALKNIDFVSIDGYMNINYDSLWSELLQMPSLKYLSIINIGKELKSSNNLDMLLSKMEGIHIDNNPVYLPDGDKFPLNAETLIIESYKYESKYFFDPIVKAKNLTFLALSKINISDENAGNISLLKKLTRLELSGIQCSQNFDFIYDISKLQHLNTLQLYLNKSCKLESIGLLKYVKNLDLKYENNESYIPKELFTLNDLEKLIIGGFKDTLLNFNIQNLKNLKYLELNGSFKSICKEIGKLKKLEELIISFQKIGSLPSEIGNLCSLKYLNIAFCELKSLPNTIGNLKNLVCLNAQFNEIYQLPKSIKKLKKLKELKISANHLAIIPKELGFLESLEILELSNNNITSIPKEIGKLTKLKQLLLHNIYYSDRDWNKSKYSNNITTLPSTISTLSSLESIKCERNPNFDGSILDVLIKMPNDLTIDFSNCNIKVIPSFGWSNTNIKSLNLDNNKISEFPLDIYNMDNFNQLNLKNNPDKTLHYYFENGTQLKVVGFLNGIFTLEEIKKRQDIVESLMSLSSRYEYPNNYNPILQLYPIAQSIDSVKAIKELNPEKYADALFNAKKYKECIKPYSQSIKQYLENCVRVVNFIVPKFYNRSIAYFHVKEYSKSLNDLLYIKNNFSINLDEQIALSYKFLGEYEKADSILNLSIANYLKKIENKDQATSWGNELSLLEIYLIQDNFVKFKSYYNELSIKIPPDKKSEYLLTYLYNIYLIQKGEPNHQVFTTFQKSLQDEDVSFAGWSCQLIDLWSSKFSPQIYNAINLWSDLINQKK